MNPANNPYRPPATPVGHSLPTGVELIAGERRRQIEVEGWTAAHDDAHDDGEIARAAACYALPAAARVWPIAPQSLIGRLWRWEWRFWKPSPGDRIRELVKAGALIAAEIDRLQRVKEKQQGVTA